MRFRELILEDDLTVMKQDIIKRLMGMDVDPDDPEKHKKLNQCWIVSIHYSTHRLPLISLKTLLLKS